MSLQDELKEQFGPLRHFLTSEGSIMSFGVHRKIIINPPLLGSMCDQQCQA
jgi:hypothetical protein